METAPNKQKLYLHIGLHKTGTTSIQSVCYNFRDSLAKIGYYYSEQVASQGNPCHHFLAMENPKKHSKRFQKLIDEIKNSNCHSAILSSELLSTCSAGLLAELREHFDVYVICFLREQGQYIDSMYRELCKSSHNALSADDFVQATLMEAEIRVFNDFKGHELRSALPIYYPKLLNAFRNIYGKDKITAIAYDDSSKGADAIEKFFRAIGYAGTLPKIDQPRNVSFTPDITEFRRLLDQHLDDDEKLALRNLFFRLNKATAANKSADYSLAFAHRKEIAEACAQSNRALKETYLKDANVDWLSDDFPSRLRIQGQSFEELSPDEKQQAFFKIVAAMMRDKTLNSAQVETPTP